MKIFHIQYENISYQRTTRTHFLSRFLMGERGQRPGAWYRSRFRSPLLRVNEIRNCAAFFAAQPGPSPARRRPSRSCSTSRTPGARSPGAARRRRDALTCKRPADRRKRQAANRRGRALALDRRADPLERRQRQADGCGTGRRPATSPVINALPPATFSRVETYPKHT